jgi:hypothetical protein
MSCRLNYPKIYDIQGPVLNFYQFVDDKIIFQFNEPVSNIEFIPEFNPCNKKLYLKNIFPKANCILSESFFKNTTISSIKTMDTSGNESNIKITPLAINENPAFIEFDEIQLKYSKKTKQSIILKVSKQGSTKGFKFIYFRSGKKRFISFKEETVSLNTKSKLIINSNKKNDEKNNFINLNSGLTHIMLKQNLSQSNSMIMLLNNKNEVMDFFLYYNSKNKKNNRRENKNYIKLLNELKKYGTTPIENDIAECTIKKSIKKSNGRFIIK